MAKKIKIKIIVPDNVDVECVQESKKSKKSKKEKGYSLVDILENGFPEDGGIGSFFNARIRESKKSKENPVKFSITDGFDDSDPIGRAFNRYAGISKSNTK